jgi:hypothetical protein
MFEMQSEGRQWVVKIMNCIRYLHSGVDPQTFNMAVTKREVSAV